MGWIEAVCSAPAHGFAKAPRPVIALVEGLGVADDAHAGQTVRHLYSARKHPGHPNLRQVHLVAAELYEHLRERGLAVGPGDLGENIVTRGLELTSLAAGAVLIFASGARVTLTGLRTPCVKLDRFMPGLREAVTVGVGNMRAVAQAVMGVVAESGAVRPGDPVTVGHPSAPSSALRPV